MKMSNEFFVGHGRRRTDAALHMPILRNPAADKKAQDKAAARARSLGIQPSVIQSLYPLAT
jgi:hypothetical protein